MGLEIAFSLWPQISIEDFIAFEMLSVKSSSLKGSLSISILLFISRSRLLLYYLSVSSHLDRKPECSQSKIGEGKITSTRVP